MRVPSKTAFKKNLTLYHFVAMADGEMQEFNPHIVRRGF